MKNIFTLARWETTRLRSRFSGKSRFIVLAIMLLAAIGSFLIYHQGFVVCKGLYNIGVSADAPEISDERFALFELDRDAGYAALNKMNIDLYFDGNKVFSRADERSQYAAGALQKYLDNQELARIASQYEISRAFPLRVEVRYLEAPESSQGIGTARPQPQVSEPVEVVPPPSRIEPPPEPEAKAPVLSKPPAAGSEGIREPAPATPGTTDSAVKQQLDELETGQIPKFKAEFVSENEIIVPSLMNPPIPMAQVLIAMMYIIPIFLVSVFFTSSFTEEKVNRKLIILLSAPVSRFQVIAGKMLPYFIYSLAAIIAITLALQGNILLSLAIFIPVVLFIFSMYLMVALTYRTFKDQTFFSVLVLSIITIYLLTPAMFVGVSDLSYISPLTLAVEMYRGETFSVNEYFLSTTPLYLVSFMVMYVGTRVLNEEYLMGFKPLHIKVAEALSLAVDKRHLSLSVLLISLSLIPAVFMTEFAAIVFVHNLARPLALLSLIAVSAMVEETAKSLGIAVLLRNGTISTVRDVLKLSVLSALGFFLGEKLLLFLALSVVSESVFISAIFGAGLLVLPLALHVVSTCVVCLVTARLSTKYYVAGIIAGSVIHIIYNLFMIRAFM